jgi:hemoglobin
MPSAGDPSAAGPVDLERLGGQDAVRDWVRRFYDKVALDPLLAPLFPPDLTASRDKQFRYFVELFGGPPLYSQAHGKPFLRFKHRLAKIGRPERDAWMRLLLESLLETTGDAALVAAVEARIAPIADAMVNHHPQRQDAQYFN